MLARLAWVALAAPAPGARPATAAAPPATEPRGSAEPLIVALAPGAASAPLGSLWDAAAVDLVDVLRPLAVARVTPRPGQTWAEAADVLRRSPLVRAVERDGEQRAALVPNDPRFRSLQWNMQRIRVEQVWDLRTTAPTMVVAVLDTGADYDHPDLRPNLLLEQGFDFVNGQPGARDDESHGTAVAGVIGAVGNNGEGVAGAAWRVRILPVKVLNAQGRGANSVLAQAMVYAVDRGARILNISSTSTDYSAALERAVEYARERGVLVVAAAGNSGDEGNQRTYPAALPGVLAVGAVDERDHVPSFSQTGPYIGLLAPGVDVPSTSWAGAGRGQYASYSGTSIAAPHVSGVAALLWTLRPDLSADDLAAVLRSTADPLPPGALPEGATSTAGVLNAATAVDAVRLGVRPRPLPAQPAPGPVAPPAPLPAEARRTYFAEGATNSPFDTVFALFNPTASPATVDFTFTTTAGTEMRRSVAVGATTRATLRAADVLPGAEFATLAQSSTPVFVERSVYFGHDGYASAGSREPARSWYLAEGSTVPPFDTWLLIQNPGASPATARLRFMFENGTSSERVEVIPPRGRRSLYVNLLFQVAGFATQVESDQPVVVERSLFFGDGGGHATLGTRVPARSWLLPEGITRPGFDTWVLVQNPGAAPANVRVSFLGDDGALTSQPLLVPPRARASLLANLVVPNATFGLRVEADQPVVVERAIYLDGGRAGFDASGVAAPSAEWYLPEGITTGSFTAQLALLNPQSQAVTVQVDVWREDGQPVAPRTFQVPANAHRTIDLNPLLVDGVGALRVIADRPVAVERVLYFARPDGVGATSSTGQTR